MQWCLDEHFSFAGFLWILWRTITHSVLLLHGRCFCLVSDCSSCLSPPVSQWWQICLREGIPKMVTHDLRLRVNMSQGMSYNSRCLQVFRAVFSMWFVFLCVCVSGEASSLSKDPPLLWFGVFWSDIQVYMEWGLWPWTFLILGKKEALTRHPNSRNGQQDHGFL